MARCRRLAGLGEADQVRQGLHAGHHGGIDDDGHRQHIDRGHGQEVLLHVIGVVLVHQRCQQRRHAEHRQAVAIGRALDKAGRADGTRRTRLVLDDDLLPEPLRQLLGHDPGGGVRGAARRERDGHLDELLRPAGLGEHGGHHRCQGGRGAGLEDLAAAESQLGHGFCLQF
jgi:hypothetical protein